LVAVSPPATAATSTFVQSNGMTVANAAGLVGLGNFGSTTINDDAAATPYPSTVDVTGYPDPIKSLTVDLTGVQHTFPDDIDILLVGPGGQQVTLMSDAGSDFDINGNLS